MSIADHIALTKWMDTAALRVINQMRQRDWEECSAPFHEASAMDLFIRWRAAEPVAWWANLVWSADMSEPVALFVIERTGARTGQAAMVATDAFTRRQAAALALYARSKLLPLLAEAGCRRITASSLSTYSQSHNLLRHCGGKFEVRRPMVGRNGEAFDDFVWLAPMQKTGPAEGERAA
ncbi:MAG: hypothetical protein AAF678_05610 [Pseudomonadota bacterium]